MIGTTLAHRTIGKVTILVHRNCPPDPSEFSKWVDEFVNIRAKAALVVAPGHGPSPAQRKDLRTRIQEAGLSPCTAIVTDSTIARGVVTAISWFQAYEVRAFPPTQMSEALAFIAPASEHEQLRIAVHGLEQALEEPREKVG